MIGKPSTLKLPCPGCGREYTWNYCHDELEGCATVSTASPTTSTHIFQCVNCGDYVGIYITTSKGATLYRAVTED